MVRTLATAFAALIAVGFASAAQAQGIGVEGNYSRADGHWGTELGAGYALGAGGFKLTPSGGVFLRDGDTRLYGRVEATYTIPLSLTLGAGVRVSGDNLRPYGTVAMPLIPMLKLKGNVGPKYYGVGLTFGY